MGKAISSSILAGFVPDGSLIAISKDSRDYLL